MENQFKGKCLGTLGELFGHESKIEIEELDCWWNLSNNITLTINKCRIINCSYKLSEKIREQKLDEDTDKLKDYLIYEFPDGGKYVTHLQKLTNNNNDSQYSTVVVIDDVRDEKKQLKRKNVLTVAKRKRKTKITYIKLSNEKISIIINDIITDIRKSGQNIEFSEEELLNAIWSLSSEENTSIYIKRGYYLGKQAFLFKNPAEVRFSIFGVNRLALVSIKGDISFRTILKKDK